MGYTVDDANIELEKIISGERPATKEELKKIIANLDVSDNFANADAKTVLYSGYNVENLENNRNIRLLNHTEAYEFLNNITRNEKFKDVKAKGSVATLKSPKNSITFPIFSVYKIPAHSSLYVSPLL